MLETFDESRTSTNSKKPSPNLAPRAVASKDRYTEMRSFYL